MSEHPHQPKEYTITGEQLKQIRELIFHEDEVKFEKLAWKIISRPHPAPVLPIQTCNICEIAGVCDDEFGADGYPPCVYRAVSEAARQAREKEDRRISNEIIRILSEHPARIVNHLFIAELRESLRQEPPA